MELSAIGERVFAAEALLQRKKFKGKIKYLVKWKGWSSEHNTWEPEENILDQRLLDAFHRKMKQNSSTPPAPSSSTKKTPAKNVKSQPSSSSNRDEDDGQSSNDPKLLSPTTSLSSTSSTDVNSNKKKETELNPKTLKRKTSDTVLSNIGLVSTKSLKESSQTDASTSKPVVKVEFDNIDNGNVSNKNLSTPSSSHRSTMNKELKSLTGSSNISSGSKRLPVNGTPSADQSPSTNGQKPALVDTNMSSSPAVQVNGTSTMSMTAITPSTPLHQRPMRKSSPPPELWRKQARVAEQILITDVTSNNMTITVRECRTHQGFFKESPISANPGRQSTFSPSIGNVNNNNNNIRKTVSTTANVVGNNNTNGSKHPLSSSIKQS